VPVGQRLRVRAGVARQTGEKKHLRGAPVQRFHRALRCAVYGEAARPSRRTQPSRLRPTSKEMLALTRSPSRATVSPGNPPGGQYVASRVIAARSAAGMLSRLRRTRGYWLPLVLGRVPRILSVGDLIVRPCAYPSSGPIASTPTTDSVPGLATRPETART
jgi:hypothetical protein